MLSWAEIRGKSAKVSWKSLQNAKKNFIMNGFYGTYKVPRWAQSEDEDKVFESDFETKRSFRESKLVDHKGT